MWEFITKYIKMAYNGPRSGVSSASGSSHFPSASSPSTTAHARSPEILDVGGHLPLLFYPLEVQKSFHEAI